MSKLTKRTVGGKTYLFKDGKYAGMEGSGRNVDNKARFDIDAPHKHSTEVKTVDTSAYERMMDTVRDRIRSVPVVAYPTHAPTGHSTVLARALKDLGADIQSDGKKVFRVRDREAVWNRSWDPFPPMSADFFNTPS